jgi:tetratricopeptide (TPR) repeat protein
MFLKAPCWFRVVGMVFLVNHFTTIAAFGFLSGPGAAPLGGSPHLREAEQALLETAQQNPTDCSAQQRLGECYLQQNRLPDGILYLEKAQHLNPQDYNTGYDLSLAYLNSGDTGKASGQLQQ